MSAPPTWPRPMGPRALPSAENAGAGFILGVEDGVDPTPSPLLDPGVGSALRILGIPGNQTTGQQRVPVVITSLRDGSVGTTVRGVKMYNIWNSAPVEQFLASQAGNTLNLTTAGSRRRRLHLHRRPVDDRIQPDQPARWQPHRQCRHQLHEPHRDPGRRPDRPRSPGQPAAGRISAGSTRRTATGRRSISSTRR